MTTPPTVSITRELAERLHEHLADHARLGGLKAAELLPELSAALSAQDKQCKTCCDKWDGDLEELLLAGITVLNVIAQLALPAWHPSKCAAQRLDMALRPFTGYVPATPEDATQT